VGTLNLKAKIWTMICSMDKKARKVKMKILTMKTQRKKLSQLLVLKRQLQLTLNKLKSTQLRTHLLKPYLV
jgi:hypothetical protein